MIFRPVIKAKEITTTALARPSTPDFEIKNERNKDIKIFYITLVPDATFKSTGIISIENEGSPNILDFDAGTLARSSELVLQLTPTGAEFKRNTTLKVFTYLSGAGTGKVTVYVTIGE